MESFRKYRAEMPGIFICYTYSNMSDYGIEEEKPARKNLIERIFIDTVDVFNFSGPRNDLEEILSDDLDSPDWHLKYARNIVNLILFMSASLIISSLMRWSFTGFSLDDFISRQMQIFCLCVIGLIAFVCVYFDEAHDEKSTEAWWFTHIRFWVVTLSIGLCTLYIGLRVLFAISAS
jgi:hypothetical protein